MGGLSADLCSCINGLADCRFDAQYADPSRANSVRRILTDDPAAFGVVGAYEVAWLIFSPDTFGWAAIATLATWFMTLFINRTEHRDTEALHAKIDELLRTHGEARTDLTTLDEHDVEDIEEHRRHQRRRDMMENGRSRGRRPF